MMASVSALAARTADSPFGRWWSAAGTIVDCVIPIAIAISITGACGLMALGYL